MCSSANALVMAWTAIVLIIMHEEGFAADSDQFATAKNELASALKDVSVIQ